MHCFKPALTPAAMAITLILMTGCGGGGDGDTDQPVPPTPVGPVRGDLIDPPQILATLSAQQITQFATSQGLLPLTGAARCDVKVVSLNYLTPTVKGEAGSNASGVLLLPTGTGQGCGTPASLLAYARGTELVKTRTLANPQDPETLLLASFYATQGYAVVATDYLGYAKSAHPYHPFLHADSEAATVIDSIRAARHAAPQIGSALSGRVLLNGYSQGGHAAMAAQREIEANLSAEIKVDAGAFMAGPYNLTGALQLPQAIAGYQFFMPFVTTAWQKTYGDLYSDASRAFKAPYAEGIDDLLPNPTLNAEGLIKAGKLPGGPSVTPDEARALLIQPAFLQEMQNPRSGVGRAAASNSLLQWKPASRVMLCGGSGDPTVPKAVHMDPLISAWQKAGGVDLLATDVDPMIQAAFGVDGHAPTNPSSPAFANYYANYHGTYEPPFCMAASRSYFAQP